MAAPIFTASEIDKLMACPGAASLVKVYENVKAARVGRELHHKFLRPGMLPQSMKLWLCGGDPRNAPKDPSLMFEASFEYHPISGDALFLGVNLNRFYEVSSSYHSSGTTDVYNFWQDSKGLFHIRVADLKTGYGQTRGSLPDAINSWQLKWYAIAIASALTKGDLTKVGSCKICFMLLDENEQFSIKPKGEIELSFNDIQQIRDSLRWLHDQITSNPGGQFSIGPWCANCQAFLYCPTQTVQFDKMGIFIEDAKNNPSLVTPERIRQAWYHAQSAEKLAKKIRTLISTYIEHSKENLETKPGWELRRSEGFRRVPIPDLALRVIEEIMPDMAEALTSKGVTLNKLKFVMGEESEMLLDILEAHNAVKVTETSSVREYRINAPKESEDE